MAPRWNEETNMKFITLYKEHECLWDQSNDLYTNKYARESALTEIAGEMDIEGFGASEVNKKIKALRATYHSEISKCLTSKKSGSDEVYHPSLKWFEVMRYIITTGTTKRKSNKNTAVPPTPVKRQQDFTEEEVVQIDEVDEGLESLVEQGRYDDSFQPHSYTASREITPMKRFKPRPQVPQVITPARSEPRYFSQSVPPAAVAASEPRYTNQSVSPPSAVKESEFDIFGKHVASQLKQLKAEHAVTAIGEISNILTQKRLASIFANTNNDNCPTSSFPSSQDILSPITILTSEDRSLL